MTISYTLNQMTYEPTRMLTSGESYHNSSSICVQNIAVKMISSNTVSSSSTTSSLSSGTDRKDGQMGFDESKFYESQNPFVSEMSEKDERYWERRRKNNAAAKRSRERRRMHDVAMEEQIRQLKQINSILQNDLQLLKQKLILYTSSFDRNDISPPNITQNQSFFPINDDLSMLFTENLTNGNNQKLLSEALLSPNSITNMSPKYNNNNNLIFQSEPFTNVQNPLDLSIKVKMEATPLYNFNSYVSKHHSRSISETSNLDQRYWDRRRRNNEAVRKCRQNKKAKMQINSKYNNNNNTTSLNNNENENVDHFQIKTKIETLTNEVEKLKSQLGNSETVTNDNRPSTCFMRTEEIVNHSSRKIYFKNTMKWKNKLIEADLADKEILNQIRV